MASHGPITDYFLRLLTTADERELRRLYESPPEEVREPLAQIRESVARELDVDPDDVMIRIMGPRVWITPYAK